MTSRISARLRAPLLTNRPWYFRDALLAQAMDKSSQVWLSSALMHLPEPVRLRASGALRVWEELCRGDPAAAKVRRQIANPTVAMNESFLALGDFVARSVVLDKLDRLAAGMELKNDVSAVSFLLSFWWRNGALYEPTLPLGTLLGGGDIAADLPAQLLSLPVPALCVVPPAEHRHYCAGAKSVLLYEYQTGSSTAPTRTLALLAIQADGGKVSFDGLELIIHDENAPLLALVEDVLSRRELPQTFQGLAGAQQFQQKSLASWRMRLDYLLKTLLYVRSEGAQTRFEPSYGEAPKVFPKFGRRRREEQLAEVEQLYDRYIIGPECVSGVGPDGKAEHLSEGQALPPHWRRGHFRQQPYGPHSSLRKVIFIAPVIVRADRLAI